MTVLLWGSEGEPVVAAVAAACRRRRIDTLLLGGRDPGRVAAGGDSFLGPELDDRISGVTGVFVRPESTAMSAEAVRAFHVMEAWAEASPARVLNRPSAAASNRSKPHQLALIASYGFAVPDTLITTDPDDVRAFRREHRDIVYKSVSGVRSIVTLLEQEDEAHLDDVSLCPTQFQQFVPGTDVRVHVVGDVPYACCISSSAVDYRYAPSGLGLSMSRVGLPEDVAVRCVALTRGLGLGLSGIDLRLDRQGTWWCFEVNTAPGFTWFEQQTGLPIADAVARELAGNG